MKFYVFFLSPQGALCCLFKYTFFKRPLRLSNYVKARTFLTYSFPCSLPLAIMLVFLHIIE